MSTRSNRNVYCTYNYATTDGRTGTITKVWERQASSKAARDFAADVTARALASKTVVSLRIEAGASRDFVMSAFCDGEHYHMFCVKPDGSIAHRQA